MMTSDRTADVLRIEDLTVRYGRRYIFEDLSLSVPAGTVFVLLGRNGSGKTSLVRCLLGTQRPASGCCRLFSRDSWRFRQQLMGRVGVVPETPDAPPESTAERLSRFSARLYPRWDVAGVYERLRRFGVPLDLPVSRLSRGQRGQLMLTLALGHEPQVLVLDDPTLGLDAVARDSLYGELIGELADRGTTLFITTHHMRTVEGIADRVGVLHQGRLLVEEPLEQIKMRYRRIRLCGTEIDPAVLRSGLESLKVESAVQMGFGAEAVVSGYSDSIFQRLRKEGALVGAETFPMTLEEIFLSLAG